MRVAIIGASGGIGSAMTTQLAGREGVETVYATSRWHSVPDGKSIKPVMLDFQDEDSVADAAKAIALGGPLDLVLVTAGLLSDGVELKPEKSYRQQSLHAFERVFAINTFGPALVAKHFLPLLSKDRRAIFATLSARVGSISDNRLGGWHAYRASKAALNMLIKNYAIELSRSRPEAIIVSLHPGTVDTQLSKPFQGNVPEGKLFTPKQSADYLLEVMDRLQPNQSGKAFDWAGKEIPA